MNHIHALNIFPHSGRSDSLMFPNTVNIIFAFSQTATNIYGSILFHEFEQQYTNVFEKNGTFTLYTHIPEEDSRCFLNQHSLHSCYIHSRQY